MQFDTIKVSSFYRDHGVLGISIRNYVIAILFLGISIGIIGTIVMGVARKGWRVWISPTLVFNI